MRAIENKLVGRIWPPGLEFDTGGLNALYPEATVLSLVSSA